MLIALLMGQAMAYGPPPACRCECQCPPPVERQYEEVRLDGGFFVNEGGVGPAFSPPVYSGGGFVVVDGGGFASAGSSARASASASASASAAASVSVRVMGGFRPAPPMKPGGGHKGGY